MDLPKSLVDAQTDFGAGLDRFAKDGRLLTEEERKKLAHSKNLCYPCGRPTHEKKFMGKRPLTNQDVYEGWCIRCYPEKIPKNVLEEFEKRNKPAARTVHQQFRHAGTTMVNVNRVINAANTSHRNRTSDRLVPDPRSPHNNDHRSQQDSSGQRPRPGLRPYSDRFVDSASAPVASAVPHTLSDPLLGKGISKIHEASDKALKDSARLSANSGTCTNRYPSESSMSSRHEDLNSSLSSVSGKKTLRSLRYNRDSGLDQSGRSVSSGGISDDRSEADRASLNVARMDDFKAENLGLSTTEIANLLDESLQDEVKLRRTLHALRNEYNKGDPEGFIGPLKVIVTQYQRNPRIMDVACGAMWRMAADDSTAKRKIVESGVIDFVVEAVAKNSNDDEFTEWAMGTIMSVAVETENKELVSQRNAIESILDALKEHQGRGGVFEWACRCLHTLLVVYEAEDKQTQSSQARDIVSRNMASVVDAGGIHIIVGAMKLHVGESVAQIFAIELLWRLLDVSDEADRKEMIRKLVGAGILPLTTRLLRLQSTSSELLDQLSEFLLVLLSSDECDPSFFESMTTCVAPVVRRMKISSNDFSIQKSGIRILAAVTVLGNIPGQALQDSSATKVVAEALKSLVVDPDFFSLALLILWKLSSYKPALIDCNLAQVILNTIKASLSSGLASFKDFAAIFGLVTNLSGIAGLKLFDLPVTALLEMKFNGADLVRAEEIMVESLPILCFNFPELGNTAMQHLASEELLQELGNGVYTRTIPVANTVMAVNNRSKLELPLGLSAAVTSALSKTNDSTILKLLTNFLSALAIQCDGKNLPASSATQTLMGLFKRHQHEVDLCHSTLNAMSYIFLKSTSGIDCRSVARPILEFVLSSSNDDTQEEAALTLWALLAKNPCEDCDILSRVFSYAVRVFEKFIGDSAEAFDASLIEALSGMLSSVAVLVPNAPIQLNQQDIDTIVSILYLSMEIEGSPTIPWFLLESLYHFCLLDEGVLIQCGVIVVVADAIQKFNHHEGILHAGFAVLAQLASSENVHINLSIVFSDGVDSLLHGMELFQYHAGIQTEGCKAFSHLSIEGETRMVIREQGGISLIVSSLNTHSGDTQLVEHGCSALLNLTSDSPEHATNGTQIIDCIVRLLEAYPNTPSIRRNCLGILQNISMKGPSAKESIARSGGLDAVLRTIHEQMDPPDVLERGFTTLWSLAVLTENRARVVESGRIESVVLAMLSLIEYDGAQQQACGCLCTLALDSSARRAIRAANGCDALMCAMRVHFTSLEVQSEAARALSIIYGGEDNTDTEHISGEVVDALLVAMRSFSNEEILQTRACAALSSLLSHSREAFTGYFREVQRVTERAALNFPSLAEIASRIQALAIEE